MAKRWKKVNGAIHSNMEEVPFMPSLIWSYISMVFFHYNQCASPLWSESGGGRVQTELPVLVKNGDKYTTDAKSSDKYTIASNGTNVFFYPT